MQMLIGSSTNGSASDGHVIIPNLGYKKDIFLEPSLISNIHFSHLTKPTIPIPIPIECLHYHPTSLLLRSGLIQKIFVLLYLTGICRLLTLALLVLGMVDLGVLWLTQWTRLMSKPLLREVP